MEKPIEIVAILLIGIITIVAAYSLLSKNNPKVGLEENLNRACLEILTNGCDERDVNIEGKSFEDICIESGLNLAECKKYCGCER